MLDQSTGVGEITGLLSGACRVCGRAVKLARVVVEAQQ